MTSTHGTARASLLRRGVALEYATLGWNVIGIVVLALAAVGWDDPAADYVTVFYVVREAREIFFGDH